MESVIGQCLLAAGAVAPLVQDIGFCLVVSGVLAVVFTRLKIPNIAAFLAAGVIVGPIVSSLVTDADSIRTIANLGLILLLFVIGLEIDLRKLMASGKTLILTGILQFPLCVAFGYAVAALAGAWGWDAMGGYVPIYIGFTVAASSTLIAVKLMQERHQLDTTVGRIALGILIFQDIWAIVVLAVQPNFSNPELLPVAMTFLGTGIVIVATIAFAKYLLPIAFRWIAKVPELMLVAATGWCFAVAFFGANLDGVLGFFGVHAHLSISMEMGALIAGAGIATLPYSTDVVSKVGTVKDFFVTLFFVGLGMGIPVPDSTTTILLALGLSALAILARYVIFFPLLYWTGLDRRNSMVGATKLAQISEFCLVIAYIGLNLGHISSEVVSSIIFAFVITALVCPFMFHAGDAIHDRMARFLEMLRFKAPLTEKHEAHHEGYDVALLGFHRVASSLIEEMRRQNPEMLERVLVVDFNVNIHDRIAKLGPTVKYGDLSNPETLHHAGVEHARVIVCTITDDLLKGTSNRKLVKALRQIAPNAKIIANAVQFEETTHIYDAGADYVYHDRIKTAHFLFPAVECAMKGEIDTYRREHEERTGHWRQRAEVFP